MPKRLTRKGPWLSVLALIFTSACVTSRREEPAGPVYVPDFDAQVFYCGVHGEPCPDLSFKDAEAKKLFCFPADSLPSFLSQ